MSVRKALVHIPAILMFTYIFMLSLGPLSDPDIWWHLKTGGWMLEHRSLPGEVDPFAHTSPDPLPSTAVAGLRSQWLGQVLLYLTYLAGGLAGLAALRPLMIVAPFAYLYYRLAKGGLGPFAALSITAFPPFFIAVFYPYTFERPQAFSFICSLLLVLLLKREAPPREEGEGGGSLFRLFAPGLLMVLWANLHGGYVIGLAILFAFAAGAGANTLFARLRSQQGQWHDMRFSALCLGSAAAALINPNGWYYAYELARGFFVNTLGLGASNAAAGGGAGGGYVATTMIEYMSLTAYMEYFGTTLPYYFIAFTVVAWLVVFAGSIKKRQPDFISIGLLLLFSFFSFGYLRGVNFALFVFPLVIAWAMASAPKGRWRVALAVPMLLISLAFAWGVAGLPGRARLMPKFRHWLNFNEARWVSPIYPSGAVGFLKAERPEGPLFNPVHWGGYLLWNVYPDYKVFVDGRSLSDKVLRETHLINNTGKGWERALEDHGVNLVIVPIIKRETATMVPLLWALVDSGKWSPVYLGDSTAVFVLKSGPNEAFAQRLGRTARDVGNAVLAEVSLMLTVYPSNPHLLMAGTEALFRLGRYKEAKQAASRAKAAADMRGGRVAREVRWALAAMGY